jgi:outer membrane protein assembly factor BamA
MILALPNVSYNPANGFTAGATGSAGFYLGPRENTRVSSIGFNLAVTSKKQLIATVKSNLYTPDNGFFLQGDWRFLIYNAATWGLGTNAPDSIESRNMFVWQGAEIDEIRDGYPMSYNYLKLHEILNYEIGTNKYMGLGYHLDRFARIRDHKLQLETLPYELTPHYLYSRLHGFDSAAYVLSGLSLNLVYDSRDNQINAFKGHYAHLSYRINPRFLGSSQASSSLWMEFRTFQSLSQTVPRHLLAFWFFGSFLVSGQQPYLTLMALGEDQRGRSGRGYIAGRYRGEDLIYGEMEYRFPITPCSKILGGVIFLNATTASSRSGDVSLFQYVRPGVGFGLRLMLNKYFRTNINIDLAFGNKSKGLYFSGAETF